MIFNVLPVLHPLCIKFSVLFVLVSILIIPQAAISQATYDRDAAPAAGLQNTDIVPEGFKSWERISSAPFGDRKGHELIRLSTGEILLLGGLYAGHARNDVWKSTDNGQSWQELIGNAGWEPRSNFAVVQQPGGEIFVMGGRDQQGNALNNVWKSADGGMSWVQVYESVDQSAPFSPREGIEAAALPNGDILVFNGFRGSEVFREVLRSTNDGLSWQVVDNNPPWTTRNHMKVVFRPDINPVFLFALGGVEVPGEQEQTDVYLLNTNTGNWQTVAVTQPWATPMPGFEATLSDSGRLVITGTFLIAGEFSQVWTSDDFGATWTRRNRQGNWPPRTEHAVLPATTNEILIIGGKETGSGLPLEDVILARTDAELSAVVWSGSGFPRRAQHSMNQLPNGDLVILGGYNITSDAFENTLQDVWTNSRQGESKWTEASNFPNGDIRGHAAVSVGSLIYTIGGRSDSGGSPVTPHGIYATMNGTSWSTFSTHTIHNRYWHSAEYTGSDILVMGGAQGAFTVTNDVYLVNPNTAQHTELNPPTLWEPRFGHGTTRLPNGRILLAGGSDWLSGSSGTNFNDVWMTSNNGASWTQRTSNAPWQGRYGHVLEAVSDEVIVMIGGASVNFGMDDTIYGDMWVSTDTGVNWTQITDNVPWGPRVFMASQLLESGDLLISGGWNGTISQFADVWRINLADPENPVMTFEQHFDGPNEGWRMIASPVQQTSYEALLSGIWTQGYPGADAYPADATVLWFNSQTQSFDPPSQAEDLIGGNQQSGYESAGRGALVYMFGPYRPGDPPLWPKNLSVEGEQNDGLIQRELQFNLSDPENGWNLVANPYPYTISWQSVLQDATGVSGVIYIWDANRSGGPNYRSTTEMDLFSTFDGRIAPFQAFWVRATEESPAPRLVFSPAHRIGHETTPFGGSEQQHPFFRFTISTGDYFMDAGIVLADHEEITAFEAGPLDVYRLSSWSPDFLHLYFRSENGIPLHVYHQPETGPDSYTIPMQAEATVPGPYVLTLAETGLNDQWEAALTDHVTGITMPLYEGFSYTFEMAETVLEQGLDRPEPTVMTRPERVAASSQRNAAERFTITLNRTGTGNEPELESPERFALEQNYPNPFNPVTNIRFSLPEASDIDMEVFNMQGQRVATLASGLYPAGTHVLTFDALNLSSGLYLYRLRSGRESIIRKMMLLK